MTLDDLRATFGTADESNKLDKVYVFAVASKSSPQVFEIEQTEDGLSELANLLRSENILAVVKGHKLTFSVESVVTLNNDGDIVTDRMPTSIDGM